MDVSLPSIHGVEYVFMADSLNRDQRAPGQPTGDTVLVGKLRSGRKGGKRGREPGAELDVYHCR